MDKKTTWISEARFAPFRKECIDQKDIDSAAWKLYEWNAHMASALSEVIHHVEVLVRNAMMNELSKVHPLEYPWSFEMPELYKVTAKVAASRKGLVKSDDVVSRLNLGFWTRLLEDSPRQNEELWRQYLRHAFPDCSGGRREVHQTLKAMNELRNRCAHQDSLLTIDPEVELKKLLRLASWIDDDARHWIESLERVTKLDRPVSSDSDTVLISVRPEAITLYEELSVFLLSVHRSVAAKDHLGFYYQSDQAGKGPAIYRYFPRIIDTIVPKEWSSRKAKELKAATNPVDIRLGKIMSRALQLGFTDVEGYNVYFLSDPPSRRNRSSTASNWSLTGQATSGNDIPHDGAGRGSAFVKRPRYFGLNSLLRALTTDDL